MLSHLFSVSILPFAVRVLCIKVVFFLGRDEWRRHTFLSQGLPVESLEPVVLFKDVWALLTETVTRLALDESIDEVCRLDGPLLWNLTLMNLDLLR